MSFATTRAFFFEKKISIALKSGCVSQINVVLLLLINGFKCVLFANNLIFRSYVYVGVFVYKRKFIVTIMINAVKAEKDC